MKTQEVLNYIKKNYKDGILIQCASGMEFYTVFYLDKLHFDASGVFLKDCDEIYYYVYYSKHKSFAKAFTEVNKKMVLVEKRF